MTKRSRARNLPTDNVTAQQNHFSLRRITPLTENQQKTFDAYNQDYNLMLHGYAGTGKTFIALYLALKEVLTSSSVYDKVYIVRSVVQGRDMGFLPGKPKEKGSEFEAPYRQIFNDLFARGDGYEVLKAKHMVEFTTTSFLRGITLDNCIIVVDESQNMTFQELDTIMTRVGNNARILFCGDYRQTDLTKPGEVAGIKHLMQITKRINSFTNIEFDKEDIVRSGLVKDYIITRTELEDK